MKKVIVALIVLLIAMYLLIQQFSRYVHKNCRGGIESGNCPSIIKVVGELGYLYVVRPPHIVIERPEKGFVSGDGQILEDEMHWKANNVSDKDHVKILLILKNNYASPVPTVIGDVPAKKGSFQLDMNSLRRQCYPFFDFCSIAVELVRKCDTGEKMKYMAMADVQGLQPGECFVEPLYGPWVYGWVRLSNK